MLGRAVEVFRLADEVAKRGKQGQHNPAGARTSGLRGDGQRHRSAPRGGEPGWWTVVSKAGVNVRYSAGMSGIRLKCGDRGGRRQTELRGAWALSRTWGNPPHGIFVGAARNLSH